MALLFLVVALLTLGLVLFLGEWLFGSLGWGVVIGSLGGLGVAGAAVLAILRVPGTRLGATALLGLVVGLAAGVALGLGWLHAGWTGLGTTFFGGIDPAWRTILAAALGGLGVGAVVGLAGGLVAGRSWPAAATGLALGGITGLVAGPLTAIDYDPSPAAGVAVTAGLSVWIVAMAVDVWRRGVDLQALAARYWPRETIETTKETIEWIRERQPRRPKS